MSSNSPHSEQALVFDNIKIKVSTDQVRLAGGGKRFLNCIVDWFIISFLSFIFNFICLIVLFNVLSVESRDMDNPIFSLFISLVWCLASIIEYISYYILFEYLTQTTIGKMLTVTKVISKKGGRPSFYQIVIRSLVRLIPLESLSFLGARSVGWHDEISGTLVVDEKAVLTLRTEAIEGAGSLEGGIAGNYNFSIGDVISEAWAKTNGAKGTFWLALLFMSLAAIAVNIPSNIADGILAQGPILSQITNVMLNMVLLPGLLMIGVKIATRQPTRAVEVFAYGGKFLPLLITAILLHIMLIIGFILAIFPAIYLVFAYYFASLLVVDKNLGAWEALEASRKAVTHHWFKFFGLVLVLLLINMISMLAIGLGLIWTIPMSFIAIGILYNKIFGFSNAIPPKPIPPKLTPINFSHLS